jgi:hypothetical protein
MNEVTTPINPLAIANEGLGSPATSALSEVAPINWIPSLAVCYPTHEAFKKGLAKLGEFILSGQTSLGNSLEVIVFDYRIHSRVKSTIDYKTILEFFVPSSYRGTLDDHEEYQAFIAQECGKNEEIETGSDLFMYIPSQNTFATMFFKKTAAKDAEPIYNLSKPGARVVRIHTVYVESPKNKTRSWYNVCATPTNRAMVGSGLPDVDASVPVPTDQFSKFYTLFTVPPKGAERADEAPSLAR